MNEKLNDEQRKALIRSMRTLRDEQRAARRRAGDAVDAPSAEKVALARDTLWHMSGLQVVAALLAEPNLVANHLDPTN